MFGDDAFVEDDQAPDEENARRFFGLSPHEPLDAITLRARKMKREDQARGPRDRELAQKYFDVLAPLVGIPVTPRVTPPQEQPAAEPARKTTPPDAGPVAPPASAVPSTLRRLRGELDYALHTEVIQHTIVAYNNKRIVHRWPLATP
jgi:hypothetical protein